MILMTRPNTSKVSVKDVVKMHVPLFLCDM